MNWNKKKVLVLAEAACDIEQPIDWRIPQLGDLIRNRDLGEDCLRQTLPFYPSLLSRWAVKTLSAA
jgi:hypothetical protein